MVNLRSLLTFARRGQWEEVHQQVQADDSLLGAWLHGIVHIEENDLDNARHWYSRAQRDFDHRGTVADELAKLESELLD
ncbi:hypothetical protein [Uliginosibacterium gangwonense]|uniref:hypothetical protein n=1 Tax=Uliginosibacterium gangwonense TaxID=392736 RepID=UPI00036372AB|nr:hypothetical protein [Uliginosibacterium gangwonense]